MPAKLDLLRLHDKLFYVAQSILSEEDFIADKERGRAKRPALDRSLGVVEQRIFGFASLDQLEQSSGIKPRFHKGGAKDRRVVHLLGLYPHMPIHFVNVSLEYT